jgi:nucleoside-diphosphate-sugar epimerase
MDVQRLNTLGWRAQTTLSEGLAKAYTDFTNAIEPVNV